MKSMNPQGRKGTPFVALRVRKSSSAVDQALLGEFKSWKRSGDFIEIIKAESLVVHSKIEAYELQEAIALELRQRGWRVDFDNPRNRCVYIIDLADDVWDEKKFKKENIDLVGSSSRTVYVGETKRSPEERLKIHLSKIGGKPHPQSSKFVHQYGQKLASDLMDKYATSGLSQGEALRAELEVTHLLRQQGIASYSR